MNKSEPRRFTQDEIGLIHRTMMPKAGKDDLAVFIATCERTGLDPFARQIMPTSRNSRQEDGSYRTTWGSLTTIDGLRKIAVDSGDYEGQEGPWWCGEDGDWKEVWTNKGPCFAAKVLVHRKGFRVGLSGIAKYDSYVQKTKAGNPNQVWTQFGDHMTAKCAEALALRRAYPNEMAGLYVEEEMEEVLRAEAEPPRRAKDTPEPEHAAEWTPEERKEGKQMAYDLGDAMTAAGVNEDEAEAKVKQYLAQIGEGTFNAYKNRLASATVRVVPPAPKDDAEIILSILDAPDMDSLSRTYKAHFKTATAANNVALMASLTTAKDQRKAQLTNA